MSSCAMTGNPDEVGPVVNPTARLLTKELIDALNTDRDIVRFYVPTWKGDVFIRTVDAGEWDRIEAMSQKLSDIPGSVPDFRAHCVQCFLSDEDGNSLYTRKQIPIISAMNQKAVDEIFEAGLKFNSAREEDIEKIVKNY